MTSHQDGLIVAMTGASGAIYGIRLLERLREIGMPTHLVLSSWGRRTIEHETGYSVSDVQALATSVENYNDLGSVIASGSFPTAGMVVAPCSVKTLTSIALGLADNLIARAADVVIKERRPLVLLVRETPLSPIHLENMLKLSRLGAVIMPPVPAFYNHPKSIDDLTDFTVARLMDQLSLPSPQVQRWNGKWQNATTHTSGWGISAVSD